MLPGQDTCTPAADQCQFVGQVFRANHRARQQHLVRMKICQAKFLVDLPAPRAIWRMIAPGFPPDWIMLGIAGLARRRSSQSPPLWGRSRSSSFVRSDCPPNVSPRARIMLTHSHGTEESLRGRFVVGAAGRRVSRSSCSTGPTAGWSPSAPAPLPARPACRSTIRSRWSGWTVRKSIATKAACSTKPAPCRCFRTGACSGCAMRPARRRLPTTSRR